MEMRSRILGKMLNSEVQDYLQRNDIIIVPVGTTEMHGGFPLDCETVISEAYALKMAENCDGLVLTGLPYFYAGATASGRGTVQVSIRQGIDYLGAIARSLLRNRSIMLFDEATSALDPETERQLLQNILSSHDKTIIFITHRPAVIEYCDQTLKIKRNVD